MHDPPVVDRAWLAERLAERGLPSRFGAIEVEPIGQFSTEVWRLRPSGIEGGLSLILKRPYRAPRSAEPPQSLSLTP